MKKLLLLPSFLLVIFITLTVACSEDEDEVCEQFVSPECSADITTCSGGEYGYYLYNEKEYYCEDEECLDATRDLYVAAGCLDASAALDINSQDYIQLRALSLKVIAEARAASGCN